MIEDSGCNTANGLLCDTCEDSVTNFLEYSSTYPSSTVWGRIRGRWENWRWRKVLHAKIVAPATVTAVPPTAAKSMFIESTMDLK